MSPNADASVNYYEKFASYLNELLQNYTNLAELLNRKLAAVSRFDVKSLDSIMKDEQVFVLVSRGFDSNIQMYRDKLSLKGGSLSAVIRELPEEYQAEFDLLYIKLRSKLDEVKGLNERCQSLIEERIYTVERKMHQLDKSSTASYDKQGTQNKPSSSSDAHVLHKSI